MTIHKEALTLALKDLKWVDNWLCEKPMSECVTKLRKAITAIKEALAQSAVAEQHKQSTTCGEPVAIDAKMDDVLRKAIVRSGKVITPPQPKKSEQEHEVLGFNGWGFPIEKPNKALIEKTADHDVDCLCIDCSMVDEQDDVPWTDKAFERLCENWNNMTSAEFAIVQRFLFGVYAHPPVPTAQLKEPEQEPVAWITQGGKGWLRWHKSYDDNKDNVPLYTTPPQRKPLTDEQREVIAKGWRGRNWTLGDVIDAVEAAHGIKGDA